MFARRSSRFQSYNSESPICERHQGPADVGNRILSRACWLSESRSLSTVLWYRQASLSQPSVRNKQDSQFDHRIDWFFQILRFMKPGQLHIYLLLLFQHQFRVPLMCQWTLRKRLWQARGSTLKNVQSSTGFSALLALTGGPGHSTGNPFEVRILAFWTTVRTLSTPGL